jgi:Ser-tRNA(Ala) deacylase AlaX
MKTELIYLEKPDQLDATAEIIMGKTQDDTILIATETTPFYPKGGGQPADQGSLRSPSGQEHDVLAVAKDANGLVWHSLSASSDLMMIGDKIKLSVDPKMRSHHTRLHTAGELICAAAKHAGFDRWTVATACHFPDQCRVVFDAHGDDPDLDEAGKRIEEQIGQMLAHDHTVTLKFVSSLGELQAYHALEAGKSFPEWPVRLVSPWPDFWRPCVGSHVSRISEIGEISLRKVKRKKGMISVGYNVG